MLFCIKLAEEEGAWRIIFLRFLWAITGRVACVNSLQPHLTSMEAGKYTLALCLGWRENGFDE